MTDKYEIRLQRLRTAWLKEYRQTAKCHILGKFWRFAPGISDKLFEKLRYFCCFVGHGRSGGTLVGALLNAHPNVVMSNELNAIRQLALGLGELELYRAIYVISRRQAQRGSMGGGGYSYNVPGQWQGRHEELLVIGDRKAGATAFEIARNPNVLDIFERKVRLEKKFVHVARNPFDNIATTYKKTLPRPGEAAEDHLSREIDNYFGRCEAVRLVTSRFGTSSICFVQHEGLIERPTTHLHRLCQFLELPCKQDYVHDCGTIVKKSPTQTRFSLTWPDHLKELVLERIANYPWLKCYQFES